VRLAVGSLASGPTATVDDVGRIHPTGAGWNLELWVGADDRWRVPSTDRPVWRGSPGGVPVVESAWRVPGGEVVQRVFGVAEAGSATVVEVENDSGGPVALAAVVRRAPRRRLARIRVDGTVVTAARHRLSLPSPPRRGIVAPAPEVERAVVAGTAGVPATRRDWRGRLAGAFLVPVARTVVARFGLGPAPVDPRALPDASAVTRGWRALLDAGPRCELPDPALSAAVSAARAQALLDPQPGAVVGWDALRAADATFVAADPPTVLASVRALLVDDRGPDVDLLPGMPADWLGLPVALHDEPTRTGSASFALRWHGDRPALLWDVPNDVGVTASALDPAWRGAGGRGEALLAPPPRRLLDLRGRGAGDGTPIARPGSFA
jgi:hypothetical protein